MPSAKRLKHKVAFVVQRYGGDVLGGSELLCRLLAEHLSDAFDVEILTTCAKDYITWKNEFSEGEERLNGVIIRRFRTDTQRDIEEFNRLSVELFSKPHTRDDEVVWLERQGPVCSDMIEYINRNKEAYDCFVFFTYLYYTTFQGLLLVADKSVLVPTAHDEPPIHLAIFRPLFSMPRAFAFNTEEEKRFVHETFGNQSIRHDVIGVGIDCPKDIDGARFRRKYEIRDGFLLYAGRLDELKGFGLFDNFLRYKKERKLKNKLKLVLIGRSNVKVPRDDDIISLGYVSEQDKLDAMNAGSVLVMPSRFESLSFVVLESMLCGTPVLVNEDSEVLKGHCLRSNAGLYYSSGEEFSACLDLLLSDQKLRERMGQNGQLYVKANYDWETIIAKYSVLFDWVIGQRNGS